MNYETARDWEEDTRKGYEEARAGAAWRGIVARPEKPLLDNQAGFLRPVLQGRLLSCGHTVERLTAIRLNLPGGILICPECGMRERRVTAILDLDTLRLECSRGVTLLASWQVEQARQS